MEKKLSILENLNNLEGWQLQNGAVVYHLEEKTVEEIKKIADDNLDMKNLFELSQGHLSLSKKIMLMEELKKIKDKYKNTSEQTLKIFNKLIESAEYLRDLVEEENIDDYMVAGDIWFFPGGIMNLIRLYGLKKAYNFPLKGKALYEYIESVTSYYDVLKGLKVIPNFPNEELLNFNKSFFKEGWDGLVENNTSIKRGQFLLEDLCEDIQENMKKKEYDDSYIVHFVYEKYTPSSIVLKQVKEFIEERIKTNYLKDLEIIFWPSEYSGFKEARELFNNEKYKFTGEKLVIKFT